MVPFQSKLDQVVHDATICIGKVDPCYYNLPIVVVRIPQEFVQAKRMLHTAATPFRNPFWTVLSMYAFLTIKDSRELAR